MKKVNELLHQAEAIHNSFQNPEYAKGGTYIDDQETFWLNVQDYWRTRTGDAGGVANVVRVYIYWLEQHRK